MERTRELINELKKRKIESGEIAPSQFQTQLLNIFSLKKVQSDKSEILNKFSDQIELAEKNGISKEDLVKNLQHLHDVWMHNKVEDSEPARVICPILYHKLSDPLFLSLIADDLVYFKNKEEEIHPQKALQIACFAGSSNIGDYLLEKYSDYITQDFILPFSISSGNDAWVKSLAQAQIDNGLNFPKSIYLYGSNSLAKEIESMFLEQKKEVVYESDEHIQKVVFNFNDQFLRLIREHLAQESERNREIFFQELEKTLPKLKTSMLSKDEESFPRKLTPLS